MRNKVKKLSVCAAALCAVLTAGMLGACGEEPIDYASLDFNGFAAISESTWDKKEISYQIVSSSVADPNNCNAAGADNSLRSCVLINLYADNTLVYYQLGVYNIDGLPDPQWYDEDRYIAWAFFGFWEVSADESTIDLWYLCKKSPEGPVEKTSAWAAQDYCYDIKATKQSDGSYLIVNVDVDDPSLVLKTLGFNSMAEEMVARENYTLRTGSDIVYSTLNSFVEAATWNADEWIAI